MQPEDIIRAKEWQQLNEEERRAIKPLAATAGEYNVLKKMFLIVYEDAEQVPAINSSVQQNLYRYLHQPAKKRSMALWYAAAASVIVVALATFFLLQPGKRHEIADTPTTKPVRQNPATTLEKRETPGVPEPKEESTKIVKTPKAKSIRKQPYIRKDSVINLTDVAYINTSVIENENLLVFVTEVY